MNVNLSRKSALVCGASQGIGAACARQLAQQGANVILFARNKASLLDVLQTLDTAKDQRHVLLTADFADTLHVKHTIQNFLEENNSIEILINNTGGPKPGPAYLAQPEEYLATFNAHLINNHNLVQALLPSMQNAHYGRIINVISTSVKTPLPNLGVSNTIRAAVANWAKTLSNELGQFNITVNNILPGATKTARLDAIIQAKAKKTNQSIQDTVQAEVSEIPIRRFGEPEEFANLVGFLASPAASYITGTNIAVDGGRTPCG